MNEDKTFDVGPAAPDRGSGHPWLLALALAAPPTAWLLQLVINFFTAAALCRRPAETGAMEGIAIPASLIALALLVALAALVFAIIALRQSHHVPGVRERDTFGAGEGRARFLTVAALLGSGAFLIAIAFNLASLALVPSCR